MLNTDISKAQKCNYLKEILLIGLASIRIIKPTSASKTETNIQHPCVKKCRLHIVLKHEKGREHNNATNIYFCTNQIMH